MRQKRIVLKGEIDKHTSIIGTLNTSLSVIGRSAKQIISKDIDDLNYTINQGDLIDIYRIPHLTTTEHAIFSSSHATFSKSDHMQCHETV